MLSEDQRRFERERDIAEAVRGPNYARLEAEIRRNKVYARKKAQMGAEARAREKRRPPIGPYQAPCNPEAEKREAYGRWKKAMETRAGQPRMRQ